MRNKYLVRGNLVKALKVMGLSLPEAVNSAKKYNNGLLDLYDLMNLCGTIEEIESHSTGYCDLCSVEGYESVCKLTRPSGLEMLVYLKYGCVGLSLQKVEKNGEVVWISHGDLVYGEPLIK